MKGNIMPLVYENMPSREKKLKQIAKVENMLSNRSHKPVANQIKITMHNGLEVFQSYETIQIPSVHISSTSCSKEVLGTQPNSFLALVASPRSCSTSAGRKYLE